MKHMIRKPMLPLILLTLLVFSTAFLAFFRADIAAGWDHVNRLYDETQITVELVPDTGWNEIQMKTHKDIIISGMDEISETLSVLECCYILRDGTPLPQPELPTDGSTYISEYVPISEVHSIRGTNNLLWLTEYWDLSIQWMDGKTMDDFCVVDGNAPCLVRKELLVETGLSLGDTVTVSPTPYYDMIHYQAPEMRLTIIGTYEEPLGRTGEFDLLVPEESFLSGPKLLYSGEMMYRCYYRAYAMQLNPAYNRDYDRIEEQLEKILYDMGAYSFATNARSIENATRPLIQKLQMQELLVLHMAVLLIAAAVVAAVLLGVSLDTEVFLRLMWGEKRSSVLFRLGGVILIWLLVCVMCACAASCLTAGMPWLRWAAGYSSISAALCLMGAALPLGRACGRNLVRSYQSREGE